MLSAGCSQSTVTVLHALLQACTTTSLLHLGWVHVESIKHIRCISCIRDMLCLHKHAASLGRANVLMCDSMEASRGEFAGLAPLLR